MSSNEYYGRINDRFDERSTVLAKLGFTYEAVPAEYALAVFVKRVPLYRKPRAVAAAFVLYADDTAWQDMLATVE